jgi:hypothetical protein
MSVSQEVNRDLDMVTAFLDVLLCHCTSFELRFCVAVVNTEILTLAMP